MPEKIQQLFNVTETQQYFNVAETTRNIFKDIFKYFKDPKFARFNFLPKIRKRLNTVHGRQVIPNCSSYTENIYSFLDYNLQPLAKQLNFMLGTPVF